MQVYSVSDIASCQFRVGLKSQVMIPGDYNLMKDYTKGDVIAVIDIMAKKWLGTEWQMFLRPQTLFNVNKFESYVNFIDVEGSESKGAIPLQELQ